LQKSLTAAWARLSNEQKVGIKASEGTLVGELAIILDSLRVLFVYCSPQDEDSLRTTGELRAVRHAVEHGPRVIKIDDLPAATIDDLRTKLLRAPAPYEVVHFSGHANEEVLVFENEQGASSPVSLTAIGELLARQGTMCVILNACNSLQKIAAAIVPFTIGVSDTVYDKEALNFSRGFYDALSANKEYEEAFKEGTSAVSLGGGEADKFKLIKGST